MSGDLVIRAEGVGKKYVIGHEADRERYTTLRDEVARAARGAWRRTRNMLRGHAIVSSGATEDFWALKDVSFEIRRGDVIGIIGPNGAGKSTLLKILSRVTEPTQGRVRIKGRVASLLEVGTGFHPELTGRENIFLNGAILGMSKKEIAAKFDDIVDFAGVEKFIDTPVKRYSSGMYLRLAFAVAAHLEPEILMIDEVLAVGDAEFQKKCLGKMKDFSQQGTRTVLFISHNLHAIEQLCQRVVYLEHGRIIGVYESARNGIIAYLRTFGGGGGGNVWINRNKNCQNDYFVPQRLEAASAAVGARPGEPFSNAYPIVVTVTGEVKQEDVGLNVGLSVFTDEGELLFWTTIGDGEPKEWPRLRLGPVRLQTMIPAHFLNEGAYRVQITADVHPRFWLIEPEFGAAAFATFSIRGGLSESPRWSRRRPGMLAPILRWENC